MNKKLQASTKQEQHAFSALNEKPFLKLKSWFGINAIISSFLVVILLFSNSVHGQLVSFVFNGLPGGAGNYGASPFAPSSSNVNLTIGGLTRGSGVGTSGTAAANGWGGTGFTAGGSSGAINNNNFVSFSVTANAGFKVSFSDIPVYNVRRSNSGPPNGLWQYQVGAGSFTDIGSTINWGGGSSSGNDQAAISLSGIPALQNIPSGTTVTFRIVSWGGTNSSGTWYLYDPNNNRPLIVNGSVEPVCTVSGSGTATTVCAGNSDGIATINVTSSGAGFPGTYTVDGGSPQPYNANPFTIPGLSAGNHTIVVTVTGLCSSNPFIVNVPENPLPIVNFSGLAAQYCASVSPVILTGSPSGGTFSGPGISGNVFDPGSAGSGGPYNIIYSYTDPGTGCSNSSTQQVTIYAIPTISISAENDTICMGGTSNLSLNFTGAGPWKYSINSGTTVETSNNPEIIPVNPLITTNYQVTYFSDANCIENSWSKISTGGYHSLAIKTGGTLWSWGNNNDGQLGIGNNIDTNIAVQIGSANNWLKVATTANSSYAIKTDGTLWAWGENFYGQLGIGNYINTNIPVQVGIANDWKEVTGGNLHALAIKNNGTLWAWGWNFSGQLGDGTTLAKNSPVQIGIATNWVEISAGTSHSLARKADGSIWSWGSNEFGQTGTGTASFVPVQLVGNSWASISAGAEYSLAKQTIGTLLGWGRNSQGQLGINSNTDINFPTEEFAMSTDWSKISASSSHSLAIKTNGTLWAWGQNNYGEFGNGTLTDSNVPVQVGSDNDWSEISTGLDNSTAIKTNGTLWNWGRNNSGQLGDGTNINKNTPVQTGIHFSSVTITVTPLPAVSFTGLSPVFCIDSEPVTLTGNPAGGTFSGPGISGNLFNPALAGVGSEFPITYTYTDVVTGCTNSSEQSVSVTSLPVVSFTGLASQYCITSSPVSLLGLPAGGTFSGPGINGNIFTPAIAGGGGPYTISYTYLDIATGCSNTYSQQVTVSAIPSATIAANPVSICTGNSSNLSISFTGIGPWTYSINEAASVTTSSNPEIIPVNPLVTTKYKITSLSNASCISNGWVSLSAQLEDSHGIKTDGSLWSWGRNSNSELGDGSFIDKNYPIKIGTSNEWKQISTGELYTLAIRNDGTLWGWGINNYGRLGDGTNVFKSTPVQIGTASDWAKVNACLSHSLGIKTDGTLWAWGLNNNSQLGDGTDTNSNIPVQIGTDTDWKIITGGLYHSLALKTNGTLWGWGYGSVGGELLGEGTSSIVPVQRGTDTDWSFISGDRSHTLGIKTNGTLWAWGSNFYGQLGNGTVTNSTITQIGADAWANVFATSYHSLGIRQDGTLWAWGLNDDGELGDGTTLTRTLPVQVGSDNDWAKLNGGSYYSMAIKSNGTLWTWGDNFFGQLGDKSNTDKYSPVQIKSDFDSVTVTVKPLPTVSFSGLLQFHCADQPPVTLTGSPAGGIFSGPGMAGNIFNPAMAGVGGPYTITYTYTDPLSGCSNSISDIVNVITTSPLSFSGLASNYCINDAPVTLTGSDPLGGFAGPGITGNVFNPAQAGVGGPYTIIYYIGIDPDGDINCSNSITKLVTVTALPIVGFSGLASQYCTNANAVTLTGTPFGGNFTGPGITGDQFDPAVAGSGSHIITYSFTDGNGCSNISSQTVTVNAASTVSFSGLLPQYCFDANPVNLAGSPAGGIFSGPGISGSTFNPSNVGAGGTYNIIYNYTDGINGCVSIYAQEVIIHDLPSVTINASQNPVCSGVGTNLLIDFTGMAPWNYSINGGSVVSTSNNPEIIPINPSATTTYNITTLSDQNCTVNEWSSIVTGSYHSLAIKPDSTLWAWGSNGSGQLGDNTVIYRNKPVQVDTSTNWLNVSGGSVHSIGVKADGTLWAWGSNTYGQLGTGDPTNILRDIPTQVGTDTDWLKVESGQLYSFALKTNGTLWAWGFNVNGQLGNGSITSSNVPVQVGADADWAEISAGGYHTLATKTNGTLWGWGDNFYGQLGGGGSSTIPYQVGLATDWASLSTGQYYSAAIKNNGTLWTWGRNNHGELGQGSLSQINIPTQVGSATNWSKVYNSSSHTLALKQNGTLWFCGRNDFGQMGNGSIFPTLSVQFVQVGTATDWINMSAGLNDSHAMKSDGSIWSWGANSEGQLGNGVFNTNTSSPVRTNSGISSITVTVNSLIAGFSGLDTAYCEDATAVTLTGTPAGGTFSGPGISGNTFDPAASGAGTHIITYTYTDINGCTSNESQQVTVTTVCTPTLNLTAFLEGFYYDINTMRANIFDLGISAEPSETDTVTVNLWSPSSLSNTEPDHTVKAVLHTDGTASMQFPATVSGNIYYIAIRHRNHMETWSKLPVMFTSYTSYDFSDDMQKAYDDGVNPPMVSVAGGRFAIYGGDVNQDGTVDASDMADVDNDNAGFAYGYNVTDASGDGATDASDISIVDNNQALFLFYARPY